MMPRAVSFSWPFGSGCFPGLRSLRAATASLSLSGSMLKVPGSMSTNTGVAPSSETTSAVATKVNGVVKTASPGPTP
ncbi:MAG: hypothetical protein BWX71_02190 [Deltaproteobacteria bacterium ADurb.Bin072]|nr:MAG: hypothetical protein BWX71_02190 [Deltaproteobacteria bacterium ADurb.Bin072]